MEDDGAAWDCQVKLRSNPVRHRESVRIGCGAGFAGDRPLAALKLLKQVPNMNYLVLECLAERTLSNRFDAMSSGGEGYDPRISEWMKLLLPVALQNGVCIITNMGAIDTLGAKDEVLSTAAALGLQVTVAVAYEVQPSGAPMGSSTYLGAAPIVHVLETSKPDVIITSRTADAALFLAPMVFELGWNWDQFWELSQGTMTGHLLECGCQLTGGYYMHPADPNRNISLDRLLHTSLPYADVSWNGDVFLAKPAGSGGELSVATCSEQLLYEIGDPSAYITPDVIIDLNDVSFVELSEHRVMAKGAKPGSFQSPEKLLRLVPEVCGWKGWGEISYGGRGCEERAAAADFLVRSWMEESVAGSSDSILSYVIGKNSLGIAPVHQADVPNAELQEVRLRMDGLFKSQAHAQRLTEEFGALYTNGPAGGGGISLGHCKETALRKVLVPRGEVYWKAVVKSCSSSEVITSRPNNPDSNILLDKLTGKCHTPAPGGVVLPLYQVAHGRTGDKGNQINISLIPHCPKDIDRLRAVIGHKWVEEVMQPLLKHGLNAHSSLLKEKVYGPDCSRTLKADTSLSKEGKMQIDVYHVKGVSALNLVITNVLDGGVTCSRRIDRHGKSLSDLILCQWVTLPV
ncbi:unnamed protein product [Calypogeia fissa]